ncbi:hypothetical protein LY90DRAFT_664546 [Neocallimastix californiae]|uniref:Uncharacterized protein n=1 Tax=Neocallimastix californiae TaxID=1754190 RepID=A0A1Y2F852_9FUNG|nr:hypothetical protein LY90DRAFT_664546 [Neocallimastix californiae]|eukprot:ORY80090.1 hypothetical protein LY90DRAFT_664546 [Neocallimastix californiae]
MNGTQDNNNNQLEWENVSALYNKFIKNRNDKDIQNQFFTTSIKYVIKNPNCIICQKVEFSTELMYCFSCPPTGILMEFRKALELQLRKCSDCIKKYHEVLLPEFYKLSLPMYGKSGLDKFVSEMIEWDVKRISTHLKLIYEQLLTHKEDVVQWKKIRSQSIYPIYEIFEFPIVLKSWDVESNFVALIKHLMEKKTKLTLFNNQMPGVLILALHNSDFIRQWAIKCFSGFSEVFPASQANVLKSYFEDIIFYLEEKLPSNSYQPLENGKLNKYYHYTGDVNYFLHGVCSILNIIHPDILVKLSSISSKLFKLITMLFSHWKSSDIAFFINTIEIFFKSLKINIWDTKTTNTNEIVTIFKIILNNEQYKKILSSSDIFNSLSNNQLFFNWIYYFSQSAELTYSQISVELWKYTIEQSNEWCKEAQNCLKQLIYKIVTTLKKVEVVDLLLQYLLKEMKEEDYQTKLLEITKKKIEEDTQALLENHDMICKHDQAKINDKTNDVFTNMINKDKSNEEDENMKIKSIHLLMWRYICSFDNIKNNNEIFETLMNSIEKLSFIFSDRHNYNQYVDNLVFIRRYILNLFEELSEQTIDTLKSYFSDEKKIAVLIHNSFTCDDALNQITNKVLGKIMIKNLDDDTLDPLILAFSEYSDMCIKLVIEKLNDFNVLSKEKDIFCMLHFANSISAVIEKFIPNLGKISEKFDVKNSLEAAIFNFLYQIINRSRHWTKVKPDENLLISQILHNSLDIISKIVKSIKNLGEDCEFYNFKNDMVHFINPLSKQLIYENGRIYFDKIFNLMINILSFIEPPNKLDDKYLNILKKIYDSNALLSVHKEKLFEVLKQLGGIDDGRNKEQQNNNTTEFNVAYSMLSPNHMAATTLPNGIPQQVAYNVGIPYQQPYINQNQINFLNNSTLVDVNQQNFNLPYQNNNVITPLNNSQNNLVLQSGLQYKESNEDSEATTVLSDSKNRDSENEESDDVIIVDDNSDRSTTKSPSKDLKLKKIQEELKKSMLTSYKHQSKITDMRPLSPTSEEKYPIKTPFSMEPKKVSVQKSIKIFSTTQSTDALLKSKPVSANPVHKMSSNVFNPPSPPPFTSKYASATSSSGLKQPRSSIKVRSPKLSSSGGKLSKLQSLRKDFNIQRDHIQSRRVPCGQLTKHTHSNPNFDNDSKLKEESEESSSSEDESEGILDLLNDYSDVGEPVIKEKRTIKMLDDTPVIINRKKKVIGNSVVSEVLKKKSNIDIKVLHRHVLSWNYSMKGDRPPNIGALSNIPISFKTYDDYVKIFEPLILTECWAQFQKSKEDIDIDSDAFRMILEDRCFVDNFEEIRFSCNTEDIRNKGITENDVLFLRLDDEKSEKSEKEKEEEKLESKKSESSKYTFFILITNINTKKNEATITCRAYLRSGNSYLVNSLRKTSAWKTTKVFTCVTCNREYLAMKFMENSELLKDILEPQNQGSNQKIIESRYVANLMDKYKLNESQAQSICGSVKSPNGFTLIQGPPGTGKTKTILSLIAELQEKALPKKVKILVCAPSNAGCDEIVRRLKRGVQKSDGQIYKPKLVRIGTEAIHPDCKDVTIEALVDDLFSNDIVSQNNINKSNQMEGSLRKQLEDIHKSLEELRKKEEDAIINKHDDILQQEISLKIGKESPFGTSLINQNEVDSIIILVRSLCDMNPNINFATRIGIITPYNGQSKLLKRKFNSVFGSKILHYIDINTIDGFQGQEKDIIIFSCVRAHPKSNSIGFLADIRRMNVGITRARNSLFIIGHLHSLIKNEEWRSLIEDGKKRNAIRDFSKCNYEYDHRKIPLNIYTSAIKLNDSENRSIEKDNKPVPIKRTLKDKTFDKPVIKKGKIEENEEKINEDSKDQLNTNKKIDDNSDITLKTNEKTKRLIEDNYNDIKNDERETKKLKIDISSKTKSQDEEKKDEQNENNKSSANTSSGIRSPSLKERYREKVEEREQKENKHSKTENSSKVKSISLKDRYKEKIEERERENKKNKSENDNRIKSPPPQSRDNNSEKDKSHKSRSHHSHHHHHRSHSSSHSTRSNSESSITLNNDVYDPRKINGTKEKKKVKKHVEFLDQLVSSVKETEKIAKDKYSGSYPISILKRR